MTAEKLVAGPLRGALEQIASGHWSYGECIRLAREALASLPSSPPAQPQFNEEEIRTLLNGASPYRTTKADWLAEQLNKLLEVKRADAASPVQVQAYPLCEKCGKWRDVCICSAAGQRAEGAEAGGHWLIYFADIDHAAELFVGPSAEKAARARFKEASLNWDCTLFRKEARL